jgi:hypothetical protein
LTERPNETHPQLPDAEVSRQLQELQTEHDILDVEWSAIQKQAAAVYDELKAAVSAGNDVNALEQQIEALHTRQYAILDRQVAIERQIVQLAR